MTIPIWIKDIFSIGIDYLFLKKKARLQIVIHYMCGVDGK
jgi:hypothetical protein